MPADRSSVRAVTLRFNSAKLASHAKRRVKILGHEAKIYGEDDTLVCIVPVWPLCNSEVWVKWRLAVLGGDPSASGAIFAMPNPSRERYFRQLDDLLYSGPASCRIVRVAYDAHILPLPDSPVRPVPIRLSTAHSYA